MMAQAATDMADLTLDEMRALLAPLVAEAAVFDGWTDAAVEAAAAQMKIDPAAAQFAFSGGAMDMIAAWVASIDARMLAEFSPQVLGQMPVRERIRALLQFRLSCAEGMEETLRRALAIMAMPQNASRALRMGWESADAMWRLAGDRATDYNHYTKRAILAGIYAATLGVFIDDESEGKADTRAFLDRRIDGVMTFEKAKARLLRDRDGFSMSRFLGRLRYPAR